MEKTKKRKTVTYTAREGGRKVVDKKGKPAIEETGDADKAPKHTSKD